VIRRGTVIFEALLIGEILSRNSLISGMVSSPYSRLRAARRTAAVFSRNEGQCPIPKFSMPQASFEE
jgi:hypothetical protein